MKSFLVILMICLLANAYAIPTSKPDKAADSIAQKTEGFNPNTATQEYLSILTR